MTKELKMLVGVAMLAALALAGALGIFTFSAAQPVAAQTTSDHVSRSFSATQVAPGGTVDVTITVTTGLGATVTETLTEGWVYESASSVVEDVIAVTESGQTVSFFVFNGDPVTYTVTAPDTDGSGTFSGTFSALGVSGVKIGGPTTVTVGTVATGGDDEYNPDTDADSRATDSTTPGSNQSLEVESAIAHTVGDNIIVKLSSFGVPGNIDAGDVRIKLTQFESGFASDIEVDGTTVALLGPVVDSDGDNVAADGGNNDPNTITFRRGAGITLPIRHGDYDVEVASNDVDDDGVQNWVTVRREVSVDPKSGKRGTEITITGKGFADGTADIKIGDRDAFTTAEVDDGAFSVTIDSAAKVNDDKVFDGTTPINASDAVGSSAKADAEFEILPSFTIDPENPLSGADITITLVDIVVPEDTVPKVTFAGDTDNAQDATADGDNWKATVPGDARIGTIQVKVEISGEDALTQNITIGTNDLTINPTTVVPRQEISIDGGGFTSSNDSTTPLIDENTIAANAMMFGDVAATHSEQLVNNSGNISFNIQVPDSVSPGTVRVSVQDVGGRVGVATITVAKPNITLDPAESLIGSQVTVSGTGFPANDLVLIKYGGNTVETAATSSTGTFEKTITVPSGNDPGATPTVEAVAQVQDVDPGAKASATTKHTLPDAAITLSPSEAAAGSALTINGANYKGFLQVYRIEIGGQNVTPVPAPSTDKWGTFSTTVQVPQLTPGRYAVSVRVGDETGDSATEFLQVVTETVVVLTDPADVFASLIDAGSLSRVWHLNAALQTSDPGNAWTFYDPNPDLADFNKLTEIQRDQSYVLIMTAEGEFSGKPLYSGTNFVFIP